MLITSPRMTSTKLPCAAPPTARTLSTPITASAMTMVRTAAPKVAAAAIFSGLESCGAVSFQPIQMRAAPPTSRKPGIFNNQTTAPVSSTRTAIAPAVPHRMTARCFSLGTLRAAMPMMMALSPASTRSIRMMASSADRKSGWAGVIVVPPRRERVPRPHGRRPPDSSRHGTNRQVPSVLPPYRRP